jgi:hypothetical protein
VSELRNLPAAISPSLTTAKSALPAFSLSCQPAGTPGALTGEEKSAITIRSSARTIGAKTSMKKSALLHIRVKDIAFLLIGEMIDDKKPLFRII